MSLALALVAPPPMYDVTLPSSYAEAKDTLSDTGSIIQNVVSSQPPQTTIAQVLTAQTMKDLGEGWSLVFSTIAADPKAPADDETRILWEPEGKLVIAFSNETASSTVCSGLEELYRAAAWWDVFKSADGTEDIARIESQFADNRVQMANLSTYGAIEDRIAEASSEIYRSLFRFKDSHSPLFDKLDIRWGAATSCLTDLGHRYRDEG